MTYFFCYLWIALPYGNSISILKSFITSGQLETSCGVVSGLLEERLCCGRMWSSCHHLLSSAVKIPVGKTEPATDTTYPPKYVLMLVPFPSFSRDLGTQCHYTGQVWAKFLYSELPYVSVEHSIGGDIHYIWQNEQRKPDCIQAHIKYEHHYFSVSSACSKVEGLY